MNPRPLDSTQGVSKTWAEAVASGRVLSPVNRINSKDSFPFASRGFPPRDATVLDHELTFPARSWISIVHFALMFVMTSVVKDSELIRSKNGTP